MIALTESPIKIETSDAFHELYPKLLESILNDGQPVAPRKGLTLEISPLIFVLENPRDCIRLQKCRGMNYAYSIMEKLSLVHGYADPDAFCFYIPVLKELLKDGAFGAAYGARVKGQLDHIYRLLTKNPHSRRAVITIYSSKLDHESDQRESLDIPCTISLQFLLRDGHLNMVTYMRSNDFYLGLPYDVQQFTFLQQVIAHWLNVDLGTYTHIAGSAHIYDKDISAAEKVLSKRSSLNSQAEPPIDLAYDYTYQQVEIFFAIERELREGRIRHPSDAPDYCRLGDYLHYCLDKVNSFIDRKAHDKTQLQMNLVASG